jgi:hypothetical protein
MSNRGPVNRDLFGKPPDPPRDRTPVRVGMLLCDQTDKAWLLRPRAGADAKWVPKSEVSRGDGLEEHLFTFPKWLLRERGWL